jgi:hypothetical protein
MMLAVDCYFYVASILPFAIKPKKKNLLRHRGSIDLLGLLTLTSFEDLPQVLPGSQRQPEHCTSDAL